MDHAADRSCKRVTGFAQGIHGGEVMAARQIDDIHLAARRPPGGHEIGLLFVKLTGLVGANREDQGNGADRRAGQIR